MKAQIPNVVLVNKYDNCNNGNGKIELALVGDTTNIDYFWENGERTLVREGLSEGDYEFTVRDRDVEGGNGDDPFCFETTDNTIILYSIKNIENPDVELFTLQEDGCRATIALKAYSKGEEISMDNFKITWHDGVKDQAQRVIVKSDVVTKTFADVSLANQGCNFSKRSHHSVASKNCNQTQT